MITPRTRIEFERHIHILVESIRNGKLFLPPTKSIKQGLLNAKILPNRRVNFLTIDESTRLLANTSANSDRFNHNRENADE